jgi:hypothetical protein
MTPEQRREQERFERELWQEALDFHESVKDGIGFIVEELFVRILNRTPFRTGYLLANWQVGEAAQTRARVKFRGRTRRYSITRQGATAKALESLRAYLDNLADPYQQIRVINTAPYASFVREKGDGVALEDLVSLSVQETDATTYEVR